MASLLRPGLLGPAGTCSTALEAAKARGLSAGSPMLACEEHLMKISEV